MDIDALLDLLQSASGDLWLDITDELLEAGYVWEWTFSLLSSGKPQEVYWLKDLSNSAYFD